MKLLKKKYKAVISCILMAVMVVSSLTAMPQTVHAEVYADRGAYGTGEGKKIPDHIFAPFVDIVSYVSDKDYSSSGSLSLKKMYEDTGILYYNLGFIMANTAGGITDGVVDWSWGGYSTLSEKSTDTWQIDGIKESIKYIRSKGGDVIVSIGGLNEGNFFQVTQDEDILFNSYMDVIQGYGLTRLDLDIEGGAQGKAKNIANAKALKRAQDATGVEIVLTLPVLPTGLTDLGLGTFEAYVENGVEIKMVNIMAMCYGDATILPGETYATASNRAIDNTAQQIIETYKNNGKVISSTEAYEKVGVTVSIGEESASFPIWTTDYSKVVNDKAIKENIGMTSFWCLNRDCQQYGVNKGITGMYEHTNVFKTFMGNDAYEIPVIDPNEGDVSGGQTIPEWKKSAVYNKDDEVVYNGKIWKAKWWTSNEIPGEMSNGAEPWEYVREAGEKEPQQTTTKQSQQTTTKQPEQITTEQQVPETTKRSQTQGQSQSQNLSTKLLIGYYHTWNNAGNPFVKLRDVDKNWDVINISFAEPVSQGSTDGKMKFEVSGLSGDYTKDDFKQDIKDLQAKGKKIVLSIGGYEGYFSLTSQTAVKQFVSDIEAIVDEYGFEGIDIDLEQYSVEFDKGNDKDINNPKSPKVVNMISAIRQIVENYDNDFILSWAPETFYVQLGYTYYAGINGNVDSRSGVYLPMINALRDVTSYVHVQLYNSMPINGLDGVSYNMGTKEGVVAMCEMLLKGFYVNNFYGGTKDATTYFAPLNPEQVVIGVPSSVSAAGSGQIQNKDLQEAFTELNDKYPGIRGIMTWSINWDASQNNNSFAQENQAFLSSMRDDSQLTTKEPVTTSQTQPTNPVPTTNVQPTYPGQPTTNVQPTNPGQTTANVEPTNPAQTTPDAQATNPSQPTDPQNTTTQKQQSDQTNATDSQQTISETKADAVSITKSLGTPETKAGETVKTAQVNDEDLDFMVAGSKWKKKKVLVTWNRVKKADGYDVYVQNCGKKFKSKDLVKTVKGKKISTLIKSMKGKNIAKIKNFKIRVKAFRIINGVKVYIYKSVDLHIAGNNSKKYTDAKKIKLQTKSATLSIGNTYKIKAKIVKKDKKKKLLSAKHAAKLRYVTTNKKVATVSKSGKIKAQSKGICEIYVVAQNGVSKKVKVTVQ